METKEIKVEITWNPNYDSGSMNDRIQNAIVEKVTEQYIQTVDKKFKEKLDEMITQSVSLMIKDIKTIALDTCDLEKGSIKKSMTLRDYIIQRAVDSLKIMVDENGRNSKDQYSNSEKKTIMEWTIQKTLKNSTFSTALNAEIKRIQDEYQANIRNMVTSSLAPIYEQLLLKLKS